jgi:hypothetical protein
MKHLLYLLVMATSFIPQKSEAQTELFSADRAKRKIGSGESYD